MAEPLAVDPTGLSAAAAKLAGLVFPQPPAPIAVSGTDSVVAAINETMPSIESLVSDGLPGVKAALTRTASNMNAAADVYAKTDQSLGTSLSQYAFGSSGEGLAGVASVGGQPSQATQLLSTPVSQVTTQLGETAAELAPRVVATVPQLVQLAPHAVQMSQNASPIAQTISQTAQQAAQSAQGGSGPMPAQLASAEKPATEQAEPVHEVTNDDQGDQGDVQPAEVVAAARDEGAGASPGQQPRRGRSRASHGYRSRCPPSGESAGGPRRSVDSGTLNNHNVVDRACQRLRLARSACCCPGLVRMRRPGPGRATR